MRHGELPGRLRAALDRHAKRIRSFHTETEGGQKSVWIYLRPEWISPDMECGTIHETDSNEAIRKLNRVTRRE